MKDPNRLCPGCMNEWGKPESPCPVCGFVEKNDKRQERWLPLRSILDGKYMIGNVLGEGGFGITYIAWDLNLEIRVAIKEYFPMNSAERKVSGNRGLSVSPQSGTRSTNYRQGMEKFMDEARTLSKFYGLPGIVAAKDFFFENNTAYMVMDYVDGITLSRYLKEHSGRITEQEVLRLFHPVMESLRTVHATGLIHRDISPDNIMMTTTGEIKLIDFGAARAVNNDTQKNMTIILKHHYAPIEQNQSQGNQGPWTDVYALCATMYRMLTGQVPPDAMDRFDKDTIKSFNELGCQVSERTSNAIIERGMALRIEDRYQNMDDLISDLYGDEDNVDNEDGGRDNPGKNDRKISNKQIALITVIGVAIVLIVLIIAIFTGRGSGTNNANIMSAEEIETSEENPVTLDEDTLALLIQTQQESGTFQAKGNHMLMILDDGSVTGFGVNKSGELDISAWTDIQSVASGKNHTVGITADGTAIAAGDTSDGKCAVSQWKNLTQVAAGNSHTVGLKNDGTVYSAGSNKSGQCKTSSWSDIVQIAAGSSHTLAMKQDGTAKAVGSNSDGQCDVKKWKNVAAVYAGGNISAAITTYGTVLITGATEGMEEVLTWKNVIELALGNGYIAGLFSDGTVKVAGNTLFDTASSVDSWKNIVSIAAGDETLFAKRSNGKIYYTSFKYGNAELKDFKNLVKVVSGEGYLLGLKSNGKVIGWGISGTDFGLDGVSKWRNIVDIAACSTGVVGLQSDGTVVVIGEEFSDAREWSNITAVAMANGIVLGLTEDEEILSVGTTAENYKINSWQRACFANISWEHVPQLKDGKVTVAGSGGYAETSAWQDITDVAAGSAHTVGLCSDGTVEAAGSNFNGQCDVNSWNNVASVSAGNYFTMGIQSDGSLLIAGTLPGEY